MTSILITNDDGIDAPALLPLAKAMRQLGDVVVAAPNRERSWIGKAISRHREIGVTKGECDGITMWSVDGYPADCVQIGAFGLLDELPDLVVSGINVGANKGSAFSTGSGTIAAAIEASNIGVPGIAFSAMADGPWREWGPWAASADSIGMWIRLAEVAAEIATAVVESGFPAGVDALSVNLPAGADVSTERRITTLARTSYGSLFSGENGVYRHEWDGVLHTNGDSPNSDIEVLDAGIISITPIRMATAVPLDPGLQIRLERR
jgi:5'-nucleotidase